jgi:hypothetical protein
MKIECLKSKYVIDNEDYARITTICNLLDKSEALIQWAANCVVEYITQNASLVMDPEIGYYILPKLLNKARFYFRDVSKEAMDIGSQIHDIIKHYVKAKIKGEELDLTKYNNYREEVENGFLAFLNWEKINKVKWIDSEFIVYHEELCFAGRVDALCIINDRLTIIDFKTSKSFYDGYDLQLTGYRMGKDNMDEKEKYGYPKFYDLGILRLDKETGLPEYKDYTNLYKPEAFTNLVNFYYNYKKRRLKNRRTK